MTKSYEVEIKYYRRHPTTLRPDMDCSQFYSVNAESTDEAIKIATELHEKVEKNNHAHITTIKATERNFNVQPETD
jgi:Fe-S-cluster containining protein